jgi:hypothetical protein
MPMLARYLPIDEINDTRLQCGNHPETRSLVHDIPFVNMEKVVGTGPHQHYGGLNPRPSQVQAALVSGWVTSHRTSSPVHPTTDVFGAALYIL